MRRQNFFPSIQITPPFGGVLLRAILFLVSFLLITECIIRVGVKNAFWHEPLLGTINAELDLKIQTLDDLVKKKPVNCIILGSSQTDAALDPDVISVEYQKLSGKQLTCFNFGLGTLTAGPAGTIARLVVNRYHPEYLIVGISARDFSRDFGELSRDFKQDPWVNFSLGEVNIPGWLTENSMVFRFLNEARTYLNSDYQDFRTGLLRAIQPNGYLLRGGNNLDIDSAPNMPKYNLFAEDLNGLDEILSLNNEDLKVIILEIPVYDKFLRRYVQDDANNYYSMFRQPVDERIISRNIPFIHSQEAMASLMPDTGWNDALHLNETGVKIFNKWFVQTAVEYFNNKNAD